MADTTARNSSVGVGGGGGRTTSSSSPQQRGYTRSLTVDYGRISRAIGPPDWLSGRGGRQRQQQRRRKVLWPIHDLILNDALVWILPTHASTLAVKLVVVSGFIAAVSWRSSHWILLNLARYHIILTRGGGSTSSSSPSAAPVVADAVAQCFFFLSSNDPWGVCDDPDVLPEGDDDDSSSSSRSGIDSVFGSIPYLVLALRAAIAMSCVSCWWWYYRRVFVLLYRKFLAAVVVNVDDVDRVLLRTGGGSGNASTTTTSSRRHALEAMLSWIADPTVTGVHRVAAHVPLRVFVPGSSSSGTDDGSGDITGDNDDEEEMMMTARRAAWCPAIVHNCLDKKMKQQPQQVKASNVCLLSFLDAEVGATAGSAATKNRRCVNGNGTPYWNQWTFRYFDSPRKGLETAVAASSISSSSYDATGSATTEQDNSFVPVVVPSNWTLDPNCPDNPIYTNQKYPWYCQPPITPAKNPTGVYKLDFVNPWGSSSTTSPSVRDGADVTLVLHGIESACYVFL